MSVRPQEAEPTYENYRENRAGSVFIDTPPERRYVPDMPPPPANYRQVPESPRANVAAPPQQRDQFEQPPMMRSSSMQIDNRPRQPVYVDERPEYREPMRMSSMRPVSQYEEMPQREPVRATSVRPGGREGNVVVDEFGRRREYLPVEQPRYRVMEQEDQPRYVDAQGREMTMQRSVQRY